MLYAILVVFGAMIVVPDPTMALNLLVAIAGLAAVGYAAVDGSLRELRWGIAAMYAVLVAVAFIERLARDALLERGLYEHALFGTAVLAVSVLVGAYLLVRRRSASAGPPLAFRRS